MFFSGIVRLLCLSVILVSASRGVLFAQQAKAPAPAFDPTDRAFLGISTEPTDDKSGIRITYVFPASAAEAMGFKVGDHVLLLNDIRLATPEDLSRELSKENVGAKLRLVILRDGKRQRISGKIGSYTKTMHAFQEMVRKTMTGKPFPNPPSLKWWNATAKSWADEAEGLKARKDHITVVFSFDDCRHCRTERFGRFVTMAKLLEQTAAATPVDFRGIFFKETAPAEESQKDAATLLEQTPATFPVGVASYGDAEPTQESRLRHCVLHQHGVAILGLDGNVAYVQTVGVPETEFYNAFKKLFTPAKPDASAATDKDQ